MRRTALALSALLIVAFGAAACGSNAGIGHVDTPSSTSQSGQ